MPDDDLDEYELEPELGRDQGSVRSPRREGPREGIGFPMILGALAVLVCAMLGVLFLVFRKPGPPAATPPPLSAPAPQPAAPTPAATLPRLEDSDGFVRAVAAALSSHPELARWLAQGSLVRTLTAVVDNVAGGESPRPLLEFLAPKQRFKAARRPPRGIVADPAGFAGYDAFADAVVSVDTKLAVAGYRTLAPLFDAAYRELGHPEGGFDKALERAIAALQEVPVLADDTALVPHAVGFRYADPKLEALSAAQKQFLRIGPRNVRLVQGKLKELAAALAPEAPAPR